MRNQRRRSIVYRIVQHKRAIATQRHNNAQNRQKSPEIAALINANCPKRAAQQLRARRLPTRKLASGHRMRANITITKPRSLNLLAHKPFNATNIRQSCALLVDSARNLAKNFWHRCKRIAQNQNIWLHARKIRNAFNASDSKRPRLFIHCLMAIIRVHFARARIHQTLCD